MMYKLQNGQGGTPVAVGIVGTGYSIPLNAPDNTDYQAYLKWLEEGNTPEPADEQQ